MNNKILKQMKHISNSGILFLVFFPTFLHAQTGPYGGGGSPLENPLGNTTSFTAFIESIFEIIISIGVPVAAVAIIYSGFLFVTAQGNKEKLETAKKAITWTIIGTGILLGAWVFAQAIGTTISNL